MSSSYCALLTELGVIITRGDDHAVEQTFAFSEPVSDYLSIKSGNTPKSCANMKSYLESLNSTISTGDEALLGILKNESIDGHILEGQAAEDARSVKQRLMISAGLASDSNDAMTKLREFAIGLSSTRVTKISGSADLHVIQAVNSLDEVDKVANALSSRMKEWYGLHFPELENVVDSIEGYARIVLTGRRSDLTAESFEKAGFQSQKTEMLLVAASKSRGGEISDKSLEMVQSMAEQMISFYNLRRGLEEMIENEMGKIAPNLSVILGTSLSARMLARIGSMKRMATLPASTIQVIGAERALFRSLKTGSDPPKHGLLFQHPLVHAAPRWQRGKIARAIAAKAVIAVRVDVYNEDGKLNNTLFEKLNIRIGEINAKFQEPAESNTPHDSHKRDGNTRQEKAGRPQSRKKNKTTGTYREQRDYGGGSRYRGNTRKSAGGERGGERRRPEWIHKRTKASKPAIVDRYNKKRKEYGHGDDHGNYNYGNNFDGSNYGRSYDDRHNDRNSNGKPSPYNDKNKSGVKKNKKKKNPDLTRAKNRAGTHNKKKKRKNRY